MNVSVFPVSSTEQNKDKIIAQQRDEILMLKSEITFLKESVFQLKKMIFGSKSEKFDANQEEFDLGLNETIVETGNNDDEPENVIPIKKRKRNNRRTHISENLRTTIEVIRPAEVEANPEKYRQVGIAEERKSIHYQQSEFYQIIQQFPKYLTIGENEDAEQKPFLQAKRPPCLLEKSVLTPSLLAHILTSKFHDHLPFDRLSNIMKRRHDILFPANTLCNWANVGAETLQPLYNLIAGDIADAKQINIDETPVRYIKRKNGQEEVSSKGSKEGFFWVYQSDNVGVLYDWATERKIGSLHKILNVDGRVYNGFIQADGFIIYDNFAAENEGLTLGGCWVHARRYFVKATDGKEVTPATRDANTILKYIRKLYQNEHKFKEWIDQSNHPPEAIIYYRRRYNRELMKELRAKLHEFKPQHLPKSNMGKALTYAHNQWIKLCRTNKHSITLDNNRAENAVRPLKLGAKNWLFIGREDTGWRSAVIFTLIENVRILGYDPYEYLEWVFGKLPAMSNQDDLRPLLPKAWVAGKEQQKAQAEKDRQLEQKERLAS